MLPSESWKTIFDIAAVILLFLTFAAGTGAFIFGNIVNKRQAVQLRQVDSDLTDAKTALGKQQERSAKLEAGNITLKTDLETAKTESRNAESRLAGEQRKTAKAQEEAAKAQLALNKYVDNVARRQRPREIDGKALVKLLEGKPKARVELLYNPNDSEAWWFADELYLWLGKGNGQEPGAGWEVSPPEPIAADAGYKGQHLDKAPTAMRLAGAGTTTGITFVTKENVDYNSDARKPLNALTMAFSSSITAGLRKGVASYGGEYDPSLPDDLIVVVVGPKAFWWPEESYHH